jgi:hypothetical protein
LSEFPYEWSEETQAAVVQHLVGDIRFLTGAAPYLKPGRLSDSRAKLLSTAALGYFKARNRQPSASEVYQEVRLQVGAGKVKESQLTEAQVWLHDSYAKPRIDPVYLLDLLLKEERKSAMFNALDQGLNKFKLGTEEAYRAIEREVSKALTIGQTDVSPGLDQEVTLLARSEQRASGKTVVRHGVGILELDEALYGGLAAGELGVFVGQAKGTKTSNLRQAALYAASKGETAVIFSLEMSEAAITDQNDAAIAMTPIRDLDRNHYLVKQRVESWYKRCKGKVIVKYMRPYETTSKTLRAQLEQMKRDHGIRPSVLLVDYAQRMGASKRTEKRYDEIGFVYTELRDMAQELGVRIWTAHQMNREGFDAKRPTLANLGDSIKPAAEADILIAVCRTEEEIAAQQIRYIVLASRNSPGGVEVGPFQTALECGRVCLTAAGLGHGG